MSTRWLARRRGVDIEALARADAEDMMVRLGPCALLIARRHMYAERTGVGVGLFPPHHWGRVRKIIGERYGAPTR